MRRKRREKKLKRKTSIIMNLQFAVFGEESLAGSRQMIVGHSQQRKDADEC